MAWMKACSFGFACEPAREAAFWMAAYARALMLRVSGLR